MDPQLESVSKENPLDAVKVTKVLSRRRESLHKVLEDEKGSHAYLYHRDEWLDFAFGDV